MNLFQKLAAMRRRKEDLNEEIQGHLRMAAQDRVERGEEPSEARSGALREFGNVPLIKDVTRETWGCMWLEWFGRDLRYAIRQLRKAPGFTVTVVLTLALVIGANTAIFSLSYAMLLRSLPVMQADRVVQIKLDMHDKKALSVQAVLSGGNFVQAELSGGIFDALEKTQKVFSGMCFWSSSPLGLRQKNGTSPIASAEISGDCFRMLGLHAAMGRLFSSSEDRPGGGKEGYPVVLSYAYWVSHLGRDPSVLGRKLEFEDSMTSSGSNTAVVVGVLEPDFQSVEVGDAPQIFVPSEFRGNFKRHNFGSANALVFARLKNGVSPQQAQSQIETSFSTWIDAKHPDWWTHGPYRLPWKDQRWVVVSARSGYSYLGERYKKPLAILEMLVGLSLLVACAYLATLSSARSLTRRHEFAVRVALGASRRRILGQICMESLILAAMGAGIGVLFAWGAGPFLLHFISPVDDPITLNLAPGRMVLLFTIAVSGFAILLFGLAPALRASRTDPVTDLKEGQPSAAGHLRRKRPGTWLVPVQIAFSMVIVVSAVLLSGSLVRLLSQDLGFSTQGVVSVDADFTHHFEANPKIPQNWLYSSLLERLNHAPGVEAASLSQSQQISGGMYMYQARSVLPSGQERTDSLLLELSVAPRYLQALGIPLLAGRDISETDREHSPRVCLLSLSAARYFFPDGKALGGVLQMPDYSTKTPKEKPVQVVGIVQDTKYRNLRDQPPRMIYLPYRQERLLPWSYFVVKARNVSIAVASLRDILRELAPDAILYQPVTMKQLVDGSAGRERLLTTLANFFAALALLLMTVGLYGLLSYSVVLRKKEIGIRMALGASRAQVVRMVLRQTMWLVVPGLLLGAVASVAMTRLLASLLYGAGPLDPFSFAVSLALLLGAAALASWMPARRAASIDPMQALRAE